MVLHNKQLRQRETALVTAPTGPPLTTEVSRGFEEMLSDIDLEDIPTLLCFVVVF